MGQKVNPISFRLGVTSSCSSIWYASNASRYIENLKSDVLIRSYVMRKFKYAYVSQVIIKRRSELVSIVIYSARPGVIIGKKGSDIDRLRKKLADFIGGAVDIDIVEVRKPEISAPLIADTICQQLENRMSFRRVMKKAMQSSMRYGAKGVKIACSGRLSGADIARTEWYKDGQVPLHKIKADIEYSFREAFTIYGVIGVKVWIYRGDLVV